MTKAEALAILGPIRAKHFPKRQWCEERKEHFYYMLDGRPSGYQSVIRAAKERLKKLDKKAAEERQRKRRNIEQPTN